MPAKSQTSAAPYLPRKGDIASLNEAAHSCRGCDLYRRATQVVFGKGARRAAIVLVGEQPGDQEDLAGEPFVGPAGQLLDRALKEAGIARAKCYITNAVKHFKWEPRGKRRIHKKPSATEIKACFPWLNAEITNLRPRIIVTLGVTAGQSLFGPGFKLKDHRGVPGDWNPNPIEVEPEIFKPGSSRPIGRRVRTPKVVATIHPSAILRLSGGDREAAFRELVRDLTAARKLMK